MIAFKSFRRTQMALAGIELIHMLRQGQYQPPCGGRSAPGRAVLPADCLKYESRAPAELTLLIRQNRK